MTASPPKPYRVLFVCTGNTCRSPMAAAILAHLARAGGCAVEAFSAGTFPAPGAEMARLARASLTEAGIEAGPHRATPLTAGLLEKYDLIVAMEPDHIERIRILAPKIRIPLTLLGTYGFPPADRIEDPIGGDEGVYRATREEITRRAEALLRRIIVARPPAGGLRAGAETSSVPSSAAPVGPCRTPLYAVQKEAGAHFLDFAGYELPRDFGSILAEHAAVRNGAALFDVSHMGRLLVEEAGPLDLILSRPVTDLPAGRARYALLLTQDATVVDDLVAYRTGTGHSAPLGLVVNASRRSAVKDCFSRHGVRLRDETEGTAMLALQGPRAAEILRGIDEGLADLPRWGARAVDEGLLAGSKVMRTGYTGEDGFEFLLPAGLGEGIWRDLVARGATPAGLGARDLARLEAALPLYGHELDEATDPEEAGLGWAMREGRGAHWEKALAERRRSPRRVRVGLQLFASPAARGGEEVLDAEGNEIGRVTSGAPSPIVGKPIALALVSETSPGRRPTAHGVCVRGRRIAAEETILPFVRRTSGSPRGGSPRKGVMS